MRLRKGWFAVARTTFEHPAFKKEPYTEVMAFLWLVANAAYEPSCGLERGELYATVRELASAWDWNCSKVFRYLQKLERETILERFSKQNRNGFRIRNYEKYQAFSPDHETDLKQEWNESGTESEIRTIFPNNKQITNKGEPPRSKSNWFAPLTDDIKRDNRFMLAGRQPLKPYPKIWLTPDEAAQLKKLFDQKRLTKTERNLVFQKAVARLTDYEQQGRNTERVGVFNWLTGWVLDSVRPAEPSDQPKRPAPSAYQAPWEQPDFRPGDPAKDLHQQEMSND